MPTLSRSIYEKTRILFFITKSRLIEEYKESIEKLTEEITKLQEEIRKLQETEKQRTKQLELEKQTSAKQLAALNAEKV